MVSLLCKYRSEQSFVFKQLIQFTIQLYPDLMLDFYIQVYRDRIFSSNFELAR